MATTPVKPTTSAAQVQKPVVKTEPSHEQVPMQGEPPKSNMAPSPEYEENPTLEGTKDEMEAGRAALSDVEGRTRAEMEEGKRIVSRHPQPGKERKQEREAE